VGLRCRNPPRHFSQLKAREILLIEIPSVNQRYFLRLYLGGFLHLKPTAGCQISTLVFKTKLWRRGLYKYPMKNILRTAKLLPTWDFNQKYFPGLSVN
jgi:hypothetical protein